MGEGSQRLSEAEKEPGRGGSCIRMVQSRDPNSPGAPLTAEARAVCGSRARAPPPSPALSLGRRSLRAFASGTCRRLPGSGSERSRGRAPGAPARAVRDPSSVGGCGREGSCFRENPGLASRGGGETWQELNVCARSGVCARLPSPTRLPRSPPPAPRAPPGRCGGRFPGTFQESASRDRSPRLRFKEARALMRRLQGSRAESRCGRGAAAWKPETPPSSDPAPRGARRQVGQVPSRCPLASQYLPHPHPPSSSLLPVVEGDDLFPSHPHHHASARRDPPLYRVRVGRGGAQKSAPPTLRTTKPGPAGPCQGRRPLQGWGGGLGKGPRGSPPTVS